MCAFGPTLMQGSAFNSCVCPSEACCETLFRVGFGSSRLYAVSLDARMNMKTKVSGCQASMIER